MKYELGRTWFSLFLPRTSSTTSTTINQKPW